MMKNIVVCGLAVLIAFGSLAGCGKAPGQTEPVKTAATDSGAEKAVTAETSAKASTEAPEVITDSDGLPQIRVTWNEGKEEIPSSAGSIEWMTRDEKTGETQGIAACGADPLPYLTKEYPDLPYLPIESWITIEFLNTPAPDSVTLSDIILREDGTSKYQEETVETQKLQLEGQKAQLYLSTNFWAMLSSDLSTYQKGGVIRGFRLNCSWENGSSADYGFVIRTDAACGVEDHSAEVYPMSMCGTGVNVYTAIEKLEDHDGSIKLEAALDNQTSQEYTFGEKPELYRYEGPEPEEVPLKPDAAWHDIAYVLKPNGKASFTADLGAMYGRLEPGYYAYYKELTNTETGEKEKASVIFTVAG